MLLFLFTLLSFSIILSEDRIFSTIQMLDEIRIINSENFQIEQSIMTEFEISNGEDCMAFDNEMDCNMTSGCEWMMGMCMELILTEMH